MHNLCELFLKMTAQPDKDIHILLEDQQKINKFARQNQRLEDVKDELKEKHNEIQTLKDAETDIEEMALTCDEGAKVPYLVGEIFVMETPEDVQTFLEERKAEVEEEVKVLEEKAESIKAIMSDLKTHLYAKFGDAINLEADD